MKTRNNWKECSNKETNLYHMKWKESSRGIDFSVLTKNCNNKQVLIYYNIFSL